MVNHSLHFVDPTSGVNTQTVESYWNRVKTKFKRMMGVTSAQLALHLDEFMWRKRRGKTASQAFNNVCADISTYIIMEKWQYICPIVLYVMCHAPVTYRKSYHLYGIQW